MEKDCREIVLTICMDMEKNHIFSSAALEKALRSNQFMDKRDRAFVSRLTEGVTEYRFQLDEIIRKYSKTKPEKLKKLILVVLRMGIYQMLYMDSVPNTAACNESVKMVKKHGMGSLSGYVNGVLRTIGRELDALGMAGTSLSMWEDAETYEKVLKKLAGRCSMDVKYSTPNMICDLLVKSYGTELAETILGAQYKDRETVVRINETKTTKQDLITKWSEAGISVSEGSISHNALKISGYDFIRKIPGFRSGEFSVQDESSMAAVEAGVNALLSAYPTEKKDFYAMDLCAAPGGKSLYTAELLTKRVTLVSRDISEDKVDRIKENAERLGLSEICAEVYDATEEDATKISYCDFVICDVPCSGLGVIGKKNDIKYRLQSTDFADLAQLASCILDRGASYVKKGGILLFSTCTILPPENEKQRELFLKRHKDFFLLEERLFLQGREDSDGFYYAVMKKV